jgi:hypothetical protein
MNVLKGHDASDDEDENEYENGKESVKGVFCFVIPLAVSILLLNMFFLLIKWKKFKLSQHNF